MEQKREQDLGKRQTERSDEELALSAAKCSDSTAELISRYMKLIWVKANTMANAVVDAEDLAQEIVLQLLLSLQKGTEIANINAFVWSVSQHTFCKWLRAKKRGSTDVCITNKMKSALIRTRHTALPVEDAESAAQVQNEVEDDDPEQILLRKERLHELYREMDLVLSKRELEIFKLFLCGLRYEQMAERLHITEKSVDNAMQRVRRKLKSVWMADQFRNSDS